MTQTSIESNVNGLTGFGHIPDYEHSPHGTDEVRSSSSSQKDYVKIKDRSEDTCDGLKSFHMLIKKFSKQDLIGKSYVEMYLRSQYIRNCQPNTFNNIYNALIPFFKYVKGIGKDRLEDVRRQDVEAFIEHEQDRGLKMSTVRTRLAILKAFFRYLLERGVVNQDVFPWRMKIKLPELLPRDMETEDVDRLLDVTSDVRNRAMILLLL